MITFPQERILWHLSPTLKSILQISLLFTASSTPTLSHIFNNVSLSTSPNKYTFALSIRITNAWKGFWSSSKIYSSFFMKIANFKINRRCMYQSQVRLRGPALINCCSSFLWGTDTAAISSVLRRGHCAYEITCVLHLLQSHNSAHAFVRIWVSIWV